MISSCSTHVADLGKARYFVCRNSETPWKNQVVIIDKLQNWHEAGIYNTFFNRKPQK